MAKISLVDENLYSVSFVVDPARSWNAAILKMQITDYSLPIANINYITDIARTLAQFEIHVTLEDYIINS